MSLYLVTGGAGFIGSHLCDALIARGDRVRVLDDLSTGKRENLPEGVEFVLGDIANAETTFQAAAGVDGCFHLAAIASVERGMNDWLGAHRANLTGAISVFDAIRRHGRKIPVVYASSAAVYGDCQTIPIPETAAKRPLSSYGADKLGCELHAAVATQTHGIPTVGLRFFNVYGPRQDPRSPYSGVISIFCERILSGARLAVYGDGEQTRDFVHVSGVIAALLAAMRARPPGAPVFNVCTGRAVSVADLAAAIGGILDKTPDIAFMPPRTGEIRHSLGDPGFARQALGLAESLDLREGLTTVLDALSGSGR